MKLLLPVTLIFAALLSGSTVQAEQRKVKVEFDAPATNYRVVIQEVYRVGEQLWVVSKVTTKGDFGGAAITRVSDTVTVDVPKDLQIVHKVLGKSWNWGKDTKSLVYVKSEKDLKKQLKTKMAKLVWRREKPKSSK